MTNYRKYGYQPNVKHKVVLISSSNDPEMEEQSKVQESNPELPRSIESNKWRKKAKINRRIFDVRERVSKRKYGI